MTTNPNVEARVVHLRDVEFTIEDRDYALDVDAVVTEEGATFSLPRFFKDCVTGSMCMVVVPEWQRSSILCALEQMALEAVNE